jgi:hypothetical protein
MKPTFIARVFAVARSSRASCYPTTASARPAWWCSRSSRSSSRKKSRPQHSRNVVLRLSCTILHPCSDATPSYARRGDEGCAGRSGGTHAVPAASRPSRYSVEAQGAGDLLRNALAIRSKPSICRSINATLRGPGERTGGRAAPTCGSVLAVGGGRVRRS